MWEPKFDKGDQEFGMRVENAFFPDTYQKPDFILMIPAETFDVCMGCWSTMSIPKEDVGDFRDRGLTNKQGLDIFYNGNPPGDYWSPDVEHPDYEDDPLCYRCEVCNVYLKSTKIPQCSANHK